MMLAKMALLPDRGIVRVAGEDAGKLLQGIITNDMDLLARQPAIHTGLLTPQGKLLFEFFVVTTAEAFLLETGRECTDGLVKRLMMYKLRAKVDIADQSARYRVHATWGGSHHYPQVAETAATFADPRLAELGSRSIATSDVATATPVGSTLEEYHAHRIGLGVPEGGKDYALGDAFPHEVNLDALGSVSFTKGCFVGQEVVSRIQHRGTARKRVVIVEGDGAIRSGAEIIAGPATIGTIGSVAGNRGLALLRLDRAEEAAGKGEALTAEGSKLTMRVPDYLKTARTAAAS